MLVKVFTLRFDPGVDGFDDTVLTTFTRGKEVLFVRDAVFMKDDVPYWSFLALGNVPQREGEPVPGRAAEGVSPYLVFPNDVLAQVVKRKPRTLNELGQIPGFGASRLKRHGRDLLAELGVCGAPAAPPANAPAEAHSPEVVDAAG